MTEVKFTPPNTTGAADVNFGHVILVAEDSNTHPQFEEGLLI